MKCAETGGRSEQYGIDPVANLTSIGPPTGNNNYNGCVQESGLSISVNGSNQISSFCYDAAGNLLAQSAPPCPSPTYTYNAENQMTSTAGVTYTYDGDGNRVMKSSGTLYWDGTRGDTLAETDAGGNTTNEYIYFGGKRIARRDSPNNVFYYFADQLGTAREIVQAGSTSPCYDADFYPYGGERIARDSQGHLIDSCDSHYKFTGKERDGESGLDDFGARYYSSQYGRFMTPDWSSGAVPIPYASLSDPQTLNLYEYVRNNPLSIIDADGHEGGWWRDLWRGLANATYRPISTMIQHPIVTAKAIGHSVAHPIATAHGIKTSVSVTVTGVVHGNGEAIGVTIGTVGMLLIPGAGEAGEGAEAAEAAAEAGETAIEGSSGGTTAGKRFTDAERAQDAGKNCTYCGGETTEKPGLPNSRQTDHIFPRSRGGNTTPGNRAPACASCNQSKGARTPSEWGGPGE
jgi:RHS repeat-associated protein